MKFRPPPQKKKISIKIFNRICYFHENGHQDRYTGIPADAGRISCLYTAWYFTFVLRLLVYMYTSQTLRVKWGHAVSNCFNLRNGSKIGRRIIPFTTCYIHSVLKILEVSGVGRHMGGHFTGALAYAGDIALLSPSMSGLRTLSKVCEEYATEFGVTFNGQKVSCCVLGVENVYFLI